MTHKAQSGMSLLILIVAMGLVGILAKFGFEIISNSVKAQKRLDLHVDRMAIRRYLLTATDCGRTVSIGTVYPIDTSVALFEINKPTALVRPYTQDSQASANGSYLLRAMVRACATCTNNKGLYLEAKLKNAVAGESFNEWRDLNLGTPLPCEVQ